MNPSIVYTGLRDDFLQNGISVEAEGIIINNDNIAQEVELNNN